MARPRPVPLPASLVVKNGSKMRARISGAMPWPVSLTAQADELAGPGLDDAAGRSRCRAATLSVSSASRPPSGMASRALRHRFISTWFIWPGSACTGQRSGDSCDLHVDARVDGPAQDAHRFLDACLQVESAPAAGWSAARSRAAGWSARRRWTPARSAVSSSSRFGWSSGRSAQRPGRGCRG